MSNMDRDRGLQGKCCVSVIWVGLTTAAILAGGLLLVSRPVKPYMTTPDHACWNSKSEKKWRSASPTGYHSGWMKNIKIAVLGDSTALRTANEMPLGICSQIQREAPPDKRQKTPELNYYNRKGRVPNVSVKNRGCSSCTSFLLHCAPNNVTLEYYVMETIHDFSVKQGKTNPTNQKFLLNVWWPRTGHPDVIFHQATVVHDLSEADLRTFNVSSHYRNFLQDMNKYVHSHQSMYFLSNSAKVLDDLVPPNWQGLTNNINVRKTNQEIAAELKKIAHENVDASSGRKYGVFWGLDLFDLSGELGRDAYKDGVHHLQGWYKMVASKLLTLHSNTAKS